MATSNLRSEIQALRNQAKARGHKDINESSLHEQAFTINPSSIPTYGYVLKDLRRTLLFLILILFLLIVLSTFFSTLPEFSFFRQALHIRPFSF